MNYLNTKTNATVSPVEAPEQSKRRAVVHLYWLDDLELARAIDIEIKTLCGLWRAGHAKTGKPIIVPLVGGLMPLTDPEDCKRCAKAYAKRARDNWTRRQKAGL